jgi:hypothetical protein
MVIPVNFARRAHQLVGLAGFRDAGLPIPTGNMVLDCPLGEQYILRMAIRADGGEFIVPSELGWIREALEASIQSQKTLGVDHPFCYVTIRHGLVKSQTDDEWHVDGFSTKVPHLPEQNYVWTNHTGTECADLAVEFPADFNPLRHNVNGYLSRFVSPENVMALTPGVLYAMDPYMLHRRPPQTGGKVRTFVRITHVPIEINDVNNTVNPLLPRTCDANGVAYRNQLISYFG